MKTFSVNDSAYLAAVDDLAIPLNGLVMHLDFAGYKSWNGVAGATILDLTGRGNNGSIGGAVSVSSVYGGVLNITYGNYVSIASLNLSSGQSTIVGATRYNGANHGRIISGIANNWLLGHHANTVYEYYAAGWVSDTGISDSNWRIYAGTANVGIGYALYVNGEYYTGNNNGTQGINGMYLGGVSYSEYSDCQVGFILAYNRILSGDEIRQISNARRNRYGI